MKNLLALSVLLAAFTAVAQTPATPAPATKPAPAKTAPAKPAPAKTPAAPAKPTAAAKPAATPAASTTAPTRSYHVATDATISACTGWTATYAASTVKGRLGTLTVSGTCTVPTNERLSLASRSSKDKTTRSFALIESRPLGRKAATTTGSKDVKTVRRTSVAYTTVMVGTKSISVTASSAPAAAVTAAKPAAPAKAPATAPAKAPATTPAAPKK